MMDWSNGSWMNTWGLVFMLAGWIAIAAVVVLVMLRLTKNDENATRLASPREVLDERFAADDMTPTEYAQACAALERRSHHVPGPS